MYCPESLIRGVGVSPGREKVSVFVTDPGNLENKNQSQARVPSSSSPGLSPSCSQHSSPCSWGSRASRGWRRRSPSLGGQTLASVTSFDSRGHPGHPAQSSDRRCSWSGNCLHNWPGEGTLELVKINKEGYCSFAPLWNVGNLHQISARFSDNLLKNEGD